MMKNTLILTAEALVARYRETMLDYLVTSQNDVHPSEFADDIIQLGRTIKSLVSTDVGVAFKAFREEFRGGYTMMFLSSIEFDQIDVWVRDEEDFQIAIFREDGSAVGVLKSDDINF